MLKLLKYIIDESKLIPSKQYRNNCNTSIIRNVSGIICKCILNNFRLGIVKKPKPPNN